MPEATVQVRRSVDDAGDLMGLKEVAECLGIQRSHVKRRKDLPAPLATIGATPVWYGPDIEAYERGETATK